MAEVSSHFDFKTYTLKKLRSNKPVLISFYILIVLALIALLAPVIANEKPLYVSYKGYSLFPAFSFKTNLLLKINDTEEHLQYDLVEWKKLKCDKIIFAPVAYSPSKTDYTNADYVSPNGEQVFINEKGVPEKMPVQFKHWLGTDKLGRDVLAGLIYGTRISLTIGIFSMAIAAFIGIMLGAMAGYFGDTQLKISRGVSWMLMAGLIIGFFYAFQLRSFTIKDSLQNSIITFLFQFLLSLVIFAFVLTLFYFAGKLLNVFSFFNKQVFIKADSAVCRLIEILSSLPVLILIISIAAITRPSLINLVLLIGFTFWTDIARLTRAEFLRLRNLEFIEAARVLGFKRRRIILRHALPNGVAPALIAIAFGIASAILSESALSFLGIGVPQDVVTWGSLLASGRENFSAWWMVVFPGCAIFITVTVFNIFGEGLRDALDPKLRS
ncbi:MAG TPA: ABC transporter permease [Bacteroidia bacterium]|nr:ABC transporter permease [Bacteroidia bacterium]